MKQALVGRGRTGSQTTAVVEKGTFSFLKLVQALGGDGGTLLSLIHA